MAGRFDTGVNTTNIEAIRIRTQLWNESLLVDGHRLIAKQVKLGGVEPGGERELAPTVDGHIANKTSRLGKEGIKSKTHTLEDTEV